MPTRLGKDSKGCYARWGNQTKYYYKCGDPAARNRARAKANAQGAAIRAAGYKGEEMNTRKSYSEMLRKRKAGLSDQRGSAFTSEMEGHIHEFMVVMDEDGNLAVDFDTIETDGRDERGDRQYGVTDYVDRHYHLVYADGTTGPANEMPGAHTHTYDLPMSGDWQREFETGEMADDDENPFN